jgi:2-hydroxychromene-2-carboxylate isomerase
MSGRVEFFFDFMSPYSYLASTRVERLVRQAGGTLVWRPCFLPGILRATDNRGPAEIPAKLPWLLKDLNDWVEYLGLPPIRLPAAFPQLATHANRCALVAIDEGKGPAFCVELFASIWRDGASAADPAVIGAALTHAGLDPARVLDLANTAPLKERLRAATDEAVARGAFGVPAFFIGDELFMGNDRLDFVVRRLQKMG